MSINFVGAYVHKKANCRQFCTAPHGVLPYTVTHQHPLAAAGDDERAAGVAAAGPAAAGAARAQRGAQHHAAVRLLARRVRDHLQRHVALHLVR